MKKLLFLTAAVVLVAAACNSQTAVDTSTETGLETNTNQQAVTPPPPPAVVQNSAQAKVDAALSAFDASISGETNTNTQSDVDLLSTDKALVNDADGVNNANY